MTLNGTQDNKDQKYCILNDIQEAMSFEVMHYLEYQPFPLL